MIVTGYSWDDSQRNVVACQDLQCVGDEAVTARHYDCFGALLECRVDEILCIFSIITDDFHDF